MTPLTPEEWERVECLAKNFAARPDELPINYIRTIGTTADLSLLLRALDERTAERDTAEIALKRAQGALAGALTGAVFGSVSGSITGKDLPSLAARWGVGAALNDDAGTVPTGNVEAGIVALRAELDRLISPETCPKNCTTWQQYGDCDHVGKELVTVKAERDRLREALNESERLFSEIHDLVWIAHEVNRAALAPQEPTG